MRNDIVAIANRTIPSPANIEKISSEFVTDDIIKQVLSQFEKHKDQLQQFAPYLKGNSVKETCYNVWRFWLSDKIPGKTNILYIKDKSTLKQQLIKSPASVWADKFADCKSLSLAVMTSLYALGIRGVFRFVSFRRGTKTIPTHVYVVVNDNGTEIIIDCCLPNFNMQVPYSAKYDYLPQGLYAVNGVDEVGRVNRRRQFRQDLQQFHDQQKKKRGKFTTSGVKTNAEMDLMIHEHKLELEQDQAAKVYGIGSIHDNHYEIELAAVNNAICEIGNPDLLRLQCRRHRILKPAQPGVSIGCPFNRVAGIAGKAKRQARKTAKAVKRNEAGKGINKKDQKRLAKINVTVHKKKEGLLKRIGKGILKVVTAPLRLLAKGVIEVTLPKAAPMFIYLFISDQNIIDKMPAAVRAKRAQAQKIADIVINKISMKQDHFMGILRNGIMANMGDTPENILASWMKEANFVGIISAILSTAGNALSSLLNKIGGGALGSLKDDPPSAEDWGAVPAATRTDMANEVQAQSSNNSPVTNPTIIPVQPGPSYMPPLTSGDSNGSLLTPYNKDYTTPNNSGDNDTVDHDDDPTGDLLKEKTLTEVKVAASKKTEAGGSDNSGMFIALAAAALLLGSRGGGTKQRA